jgi:hypothetical protein
MTRQEGEYLISNEEYHGDKDWLSSSVIKLALNPALYNYVVLQGKGEKKSNAGMELGNLIHTFLLEYEKFEEEYYVYDGATNKDGSVPKKKRDELEVVSEGKQIVTTEQVELAELARKNCLLNDYTNEALFGHGGKNEVSYFYKDNELGFNFKVRPDRIVFCDNKIVIYDVKSSRNIDPSGFGRDAKFKFHYDLSAYMYCYVVFKMFGIMPSFAWVVVGSEEFAPVAFYPCSDKTLLAGKEKFDVAIENIKTRTKEGNWNYQREPIEI